MVQVSFGLVYKQACKLANDSKVKDKTEVCFVFQIH